MAVLLDDWMLMWDKYFMTWTLHAVYSVVMHSITKDGISLYKLSRLDCHRL